MTDEKIIEVGDVYEMGELVERQSDAEFRRFAIRVMDRTAATLGVVFGPITIDQKHQSDGLIYRARCTVVEVCRKS